MFTYLDYQTWMTIEFQKKDVYVFDDSPKTVKD